MVRGAGAVSKGTEYHDNQRRISKAFCHATTKAGPRGRNWASNG